MANMMLLPFWSWQQILAKKGHGRLARYQPLLLKSDSVTNALIVIIGFSEPYKPVIRYGSLKKGTGRMGR
jgi:hypothetical protein